MSNLHRFVASSQHPVARAARAVYRAGARLSLPAPALLVKPAAWAFQLVRAGYHAGARVLIAEPLFKGYCARHGANLHTGSSIHWVSGKGDIVVGDDVLFDGKSAITFAATFSDRPTLRVGDRTVIGHAVSLVVARSVTIGADCLIAAGVSIFDSPGHPADPGARRLHRRPAPEDVRPVVVEDNVWIGKDAAIAPGVTVGEGSIVAAKSVVVSNVAPFTVVMGNPARRILELERLRVASDTAHAARPTEPWQVATRGGREEGSSERR